MAANNQNSFSSKVFCLIELFSSPVRPSISMNRSKMTKWYYYWTERQRRPRRHRTPPSPGKTSRFFSSRLCMAAVSLAFMGGIIVGILLPICAPSPPVLDSSSTSPLPHRRTLSPSSDDYDYDTPPRVLLWRADDEERTGQRSNALVNDPKMDVKTPRGDLSTKKQRQHGFVSGLTSLRRRGGGGGHTTSPRTLQLQEFLNFSKSEDSAFFSGRNQIETNASSSSAFNKSSDSSNGGVLLLRMLLLRRRTVGFHSPSGQVTSSRREVQVEEGITHRMRPVVDAVTAGWPQITRPYPPPPLMLLLPSSTPHLRLHDGVQATISSTSRMRNNNNNNNNQTRSYVDQHSLNSNSNNSNSSSNNHDDKMQQYANDVGTTTKVVRTLSEDAIGHQKPVAKEEPNLVDGVFWSDTVEAILPIGFKEQDVAAWTHFSSNATVVKVIEGCGRMQNRLLVFDNGTKSCCRYRQNNDQIQGEIFSFYLSKLLGIENLPPASLGLLYGREWQWTPVRGQLTLAQWNEQKPVVMTKFVDHLESAFIPRHFRGDGAKEHRRLHPISEDLTGLSRKDIVELAQWSDLIVFDYLTANLDRVVNNMYNKQWNPDMMASPAHNLAKQVDSGLLVFLDNESGLLHGYRLLDKYESYHRAMLQSLCIFRRSTARAVQRLLKAGDVGQRLRSALHEAQPSMAEWLPPLPDKSVKILRQRLDKVNQQIVQCEQRYSSSSAGKGVTTTISDDENVVNAMERYDIPVTPYLLSN